MANVFTPGRGFAQATYVDQFGTALPGTLGFASDQHLVDSLVVHPLIGANGLEAGLGVVAAIMPAADRGGARAGMNVFYANLPVAGTAASAFAGITVRNQQMNTNPAGRACWFAERMCNVMRAHRVGGRVWVRLSRGVTAVNGAVHWIIANTTAHGHAIGSFSATAIGVDTVQLANARFKSISDAAAAMAVALIELAEVGA